jgi:serine/threonine protein kinase
MKLGKGSAGTVVAASPVSGGAPVAVKFFQSDKKARNEVAILSNPAFKHPNVVEIIDSMPTASGGLALVTELSPFGDVVGLAEQVRLTDIEVSFIAFQLLSALKHLHDAGLAHADIKPDNILVSSVVLVPESALRFFMTPQGALRACGGELLTAPSSLQRPWEDVLLAKRRAAEAAATTGSGERLLSMVHIRVCDFERAVPRSSTTAYVGTHQYAAPEMWRRRLNLPVYDWCPVNPAAADLFAAACSLWCARAGAWPFCSRERMPAQDSAARHAMENDVGHKIVAWSISNPLPHDVHPAFEDLIKKMMEHDVRKRATAAEALEHPFFDSIRRATIARPAPAQLAPQMTLPVAAAPAANESVLDRSVDYYDLLLSPWQSLESMSSSSFSGMGPSARAKGKAHAVRAGGAAAPNMGSATTAGTPIVSNAPGAAASTFLGEPSFSFLELMSLSAVSGTATGSAEDGAKGAQRLRGESVGFLLDSGM